MCKQQTQEHNTLHINHIESSPLIVNVGGQVGNLCKNCVKKHVYQEESFVKIPIMTNSIVILFRKSSYQTLPLKVLCGV